MLYTGARTRRSCGSNGKTCICSSPTVTQPGSVVRQDRSYRFAEKADGDRVKATPYTLDVLEDAQMAGSYIAVNSNYLDPKTIHVRDCGVNAGTKDTLSGDVGRWFETPLAVPPNDEDLLAKAVGIAQTKAMADLHASMMNIPLLVAERRQTLATLIGHAKILSTRVSELRKVAIKRYSAARGTNAKRAVARDLANEHLAVMFGLMPLIDEAKGAVEFLRTPPSLLKTGRGRQAFDSREEASGETSPTSAQQFLFDTPYFSTFMATSTRTSARCSITVRITMSTGQALRDLGFNPAAVVYDLVPLSFLSDFVSNLGTFIRSLDPLIGAEFVRGSTSTWQESKIELSVGSTAGSLPSSATTGYSFQTTASGFGSTRALHHVRIPLADFPTSSLHWQNNLSWGKALTIGSLAIQRYVKLARLPSVVKQFRYRGPRPKYLPPIKFER